MSDFIKDDIASRFSKAIHSRVASTRSGRFDLKLADYEVTSPTEARIMVSYTKDLGFPKRSEVDEWVISALTGNVQVSLETLRNYPDFGVVTAFVRKTRRLRPIEDAKGMMVVGKARYMDDEKVIWEVMSRDGERFLARAEKDDLDEILRLRQAQERTASVHHRIRLRDLVTAGIHSLEPGDRVQFSEDAILQQGEVTKVGKDTVTIKAGGKSVTVDRLSIVSVLEKAPRAKAEQDREMEDFFTRAYGSKEFAKKLVHGK